MKKRWTLILFSLCFCAGVLTAQGTVQNLSFFSTALGTEENFQIYLPEGYNPNGTKTYPVIYFLHGATLNYLSYPCVLDTIESLIKAGIIQPMILVKPNGNQGPYLGSMYVNSPVSGKVEDFIIQDLLAHNDSHFKTKAQRQYRCIFGHSMGAAGAVQLSLKYPELFRAVASHSGALDMNRMKLFTDLMLVVEHQSGPPYNFVYNHTNPFAKLLTSLLFTASAGWSPNPANTPEPVDFPLDNQGNFIPAVKAKWDTFDPARWVTTSPPDPALGIWFDCGEQDAFQFFPMNQSFRDSLEKAEVSYIFEPYQGGHADKICERMRKSLIYMDSMMQQPITSTQDLNGMHLKIYPNPTADNQLLVQLLPEADWRVEVVGLQGKVLLSTSAFGKEIRLDVVAFPPGIYVLRVAGERLAGAIKFVVSY